MLVFWGGTGGTFLKWNLLEKLLDDIFVLDSKQISIDLFFNLNPQHFQEKP